VSKYLANFNVVGDGTVELDGGDGLTECSERIDAEYRYLSSGERGYLKRYGGRSIIKRVDAEDYFQRYVHYDTHIWMVNDD
jgi:hypothetical protein